MMGVNYLELDAALLPETRTLYCCQCQKDVPARLTNGEEIYPHRPDLFHLPFWKCDTCKNYVGCHHKTTKPTNPLGNIPNLDMRYARQKIHEILDPLFLSGAYNRRHLYAKLSKKLGYKYHTAEIKTLEEARRVYAAVQEIIKLNNERVL